MLGDKGYNIFLSIVLLEISIIICMYLFFQSHNMLGSYGDLQLLLVED